MANEMMKDTNVDERRKELMAKSKSHKKAIEHQVVEIRETAEQWGRTTLILGGVLFTGYLFMKILFEREGGGKNKKNLPAQNNPSGGSRIFNSIMEQIALFLLAMAKEKLAELMNDEREQKNI